MLQVGTQALDTSSQLIQELFVPQTLSHEALLVLSPLHLESVRAEGVGLGVGVNPGANGRWSSPTLAVKTYLMTDMLNMCICLLPVMALAHPFAA
jgi:hypothetical protein